MRFIYSRFRSDFITKCIFVVLLFLFSVTIRLWHLNDMGRTWDENAQVELGHKFIQLMQKRDFTNSFWFKAVDNPPLGRYLYGVVGIGDIKHIDHTGKPIYKYDYTFSRLLSILFSSLSVAVILLLGWEFLNRFIGITAGIILSILPFFIGLSQLSTMESMIMFFFTVTTYLFMKFLKKPSLKLLIFTGILLGLSILTKYTNLLLVPLLILVYTIWKVHGIKKQKEESGFRIFLILFLVASLTVFLLWPMPWFHLKDVLAYTYQTRVLNVQYSIPEVFFGKLLLVPKAYYLVMFLITTPEIILILFILGLIIISREIQLHIKIRSYKISLITKAQSFFLLNKKTLVTKTSLGLQTWVLLTLFIWFTIPFLQSFYNLRQHGIRYIIEIYAPLALISGIGLYFLNIKILTNLWKRVIFYSIVFLLLLIPLVRISPYYLDYFNILVGGPKNVYDKRLFQLGWWGQGVKEAVMWVDKNAKCHHKVGLAVVPSHVIPNFTCVKGEEFNYSNSYDYVIVSHFNVIREGFDDTTIKQKYVPIYHVDANGAYLVTVYAKRIHNQK